MQRILRPLTIAFFGFAVMPNLAWASESLTGSEIETEIIEHDFDVRRMGLTATLRYDANGSAEAKLPVGGKSGT